MRLRSLVLAVVAAAPLTAAGTAGGAPAAERGASQEPPYIIEYFADYRPVLGKVAKRFDRKGRVRVIVGCRQVLGGLGFSCVGQLGATVAGRAAGKRRFDVSADRDEVVRLRVKLSRKQRRRRAVRVRLTATLNSYEVTKTVRVKRARRS